MFMDSFTEGLENKCQDLELMQKVLGGRLKPSGALHMTSLKAEEAAIRDHLMQTNILTNRKDPFHNLSKYQQCLGYESLAEASWQAGRHRMNK